MRRLLFVILGCGLAGSAWAQLQLPQLPGGVPDPFPVLPTVEDEPPAPRRGSGTGLVLDLSPPRRECFAQDHIVVRFEGELAPWQRSQLSGALGGTSYRVASLGDFARVGVGSGESAVELVERFSRSSGVAWAELDYCAHVAAELVRPAQVSFNDPFVDRQWHLERTRHADALELNPGLGQGRVIAVIDTGVAFGSGAGFPAIRGIDLDGTQFVPGFDFVDNDPFPFDEGSGNGLRFGHGTFVATVIAATANNFVSGIGVAPQVSIMPIRALGVDGTGFFSDIAEGVLFAVANGADVINMSLGGPVGTATIEQAVRAADAAGVLVVAAGGNEGTDADLSQDVAFPARYPEVIAVGSSAFDDAKADYSNLGVELVAPAGENPNAQVQPGIFDGVLSNSFLHNPQTGETLYAGFFATGTSFAAPQVSGAAALLLGNGVDRRAVRQVLGLTTRDLDADGFDANTGFGLLDLLTAHRGFGLTF